VPVTLPLVGEVSVAVAAVSLSAVTLVGFLSLKYVLRAVFGAAFGWLYRAGLKHAALAALLSTGGLLESLEPGTLMGLFDALLGGLFGGILDVLGGAI